MSAPITFTCEHTFCLECAKTWLKTSATCPSCRTVLYDDELDDDEPEDDSDAEIPADPEYVTEAFASSAIVEPPEPTTSFEAPSSDSITQPRPTVLSRLPSLHRPVQHREAALKQRRLALRRWQTSLYKIFRALKKSHHNLEARKRAYDRQRTSLLEAAAWLRTQIELQDQFHAEVMRQFEQREREQSVRGRETEVEQQVEELGLDVMRSSGSSPNVENASRKGAKWSWARVKDELREKGLRSRGTACPGPAGA